MPAGRLGCCVRLPHWRPAGLSAGGCGWVCSSAALAPGSIAGELLLNGIPQRLIDDRRVFAGMELALVNDLAEVGAVLQHQVERAPRERLAADEAPGSARPRFTFDAARFEFHL